MFFQASNTTRQHLRSPRVRTAVDRRRHKRVALILLGRYMRPDKSEHPCKLIDISVGGAAIISPIAVVLEERVVIYLDYLGGIEGTIARQFEGGFAIKFSISANKREKLAAQLTWLINRHELGGLEERRHERIVPRSSASTLTLAEGVAITCQILDFSISGASIATSARPPIGHEVQIGARLKARVVRHHAQGIGVQFLDVQSPQALKRDFG